ncbi:uncharacterized protein LOC118733324 [Rhagoletis pomonella]|uniref:uncharacterized protein LOC118733324 n=1 Tax=Rhagoletis pomonella TaxID=28610 RepID=UPI001780CA14|nr:uncharacterized protein LOC118733324 [Rhagoletis pomonella]
MMDKFVIKKKRENYNNNNQEASNEGGMSETAEIKRKFRAEWLTTFAWLSNKDGSAFCEACNKGVVNHLPHLERHETITAHVKNMEGNRKKISIDSFLDVNKRQIHKMVQNAELTLVMFLISHNLPFTLMNNFPELLAECGPDSEVAKHLKIARTKATQLTETICFNTMKELISELKSSKFSLIINETTYVSAKKCLDMSPI